MSSPEKRKLPEDGASDCKKAKVDGSSETALVEKICKELNEENDSLICVMVENIGEEKANKLLEETLEIEKGEGMLTADKERRKTPGGVFLSKCKQALGKPKYNALCTQNHKERKRLRKLEEKQEQSTTATEKEEKTEETKIEKKDWDH